MMVSLGQIRSRLLTVTVVLGVIPAGVSIGQVPSKGPTRDPSVEAPVLSGITIDGDLNDWPAALPRYPINHLHVLPPYYGSNGLEGANLMTSPDLSAAFSVGYDPKENLVYLAVIVRDDMHVVGHDGFWDTDAVEVYVDGRHSEDSVPNYPGGKNPETADASELPVFQYIGIPGEGRIYGVKKSSGRDRGPDNPILMFGDIKKTRTRMAFRRTRGLTVYEWAIEAFDHYPDTPTKLVPGGKLGFDVAVVDKDKPAVSAAAETEPEDDRSAWVTWVPEYRGLKFFNAANLGEVVLGLPPAAGPPADKN